MFEEALEIWSVFGVTEAVEYLNGQEALVETAETYHKLMKELYWQEKNVPDMVAVAQAGMDYGLSNGRVHSMILIRAWLMNCAVGPSL